MPKWSLGPLAAVRWAIQTCYFHFWGGRIIVSIQWFIINSGSARNAKVRCHPPENVHSNQKRERQMPKWWQTYPKGGAKWSPRTPKKQPKGTKNRNFQPEWFHQGLPLCGPFFLFVPSSFFFKKNKEGARLRYVAFTSRWGNHRFHPRIYTIFCVKQNKQKNALIRQKKEPTTKKDVQNAKMVSIVVKKGAKIIVETWKHSPKMVPPVPQWSPETTQVHKIW